MWPDGNDVPAADNDVSIMLRREKWRQVASPGTTHDTILEYAGVWKQERSIMTTIRETKRQPKPDSLTPIHTYIYIIFGCTSRLDSDSKRIDFHGAFAHIRLSFLLLEQQISRRLLRRRSLKISMDKFRIIRAATVPCFRIMRTPRRWAFHWAVSHGWFISSQSECSSSKSFMFLCTVSIRATDKNRCTKDVYQRKPLHAIQYQSMSTRFHRRHGRLNTFRHYDAASPLKTCLMTRLDSFCGRSTALLCGTVLDCFVNDFSIYIIDSGVLAPTACAPWK